MQTARNHILSSIAAGLIVALLVSGCSKPAEQPPSFVTLQAHKSGKVEGVGGAGYTGITERIAALNNDVYAGTDFAVLESVYNEGGPGKGVKVLVKGSVLGLFAPPADARIESDAADPKAKSQDLSHAVLTFADDGTGQYIAEAPDLPYNKELRLLMKLTALRKNGQGEMQIYVYPLDKKGKTTASFGKQLRVLSEEEPTVPDDSATTPDGIAE